MASSTSSHPRSHPSSRPEPAAGAASYLPQRRSLGSLRDAAGQCRGCPLYQHATQTVFGEGRRDAPIMLVGEQPGDREDRQGHPFVGPAGRLLARALDDAGIDRDLTYQTNAVKHFKFTRKDGKRRIHQKPSRTEVVACRPWLLAVHPSAVLRERGDRDEAYQLFVDDLRTAAAAV